MTPSLGKSVLSLFLATVCLGAVWRYRDPIGPWWAFVLTMAAICLGVYGLAGALDWMLAAYAGRLERIRHALALTPAVKVMELMTRLSPGAQQELAYQLGVLGIEWRGLPTNIGPSWKTTIAGHDIPLEFVREFFWRSGTEYLVPIRNYTDGTIAQHQAQLITDYLIRFDYAAPAAGNRSARWLRRADAIRAFFGGEE